MSKSPGQIRASAAAPAPAASGTPGTTPRRAGSSRRGDAPLVGITDLLRQLPDSYTDSTTEHERVAHFELFKRFQAEALHDSKKEPIVFSWGPMPDGKAVALHACFCDVVGALNAVISTITERQFNIARVAAFSTFSGIAIDTFELNAFDQAAADILKDRLRSLIDSSLSSTLSSTLLSRLPSTGSFARLSDAAASVAGSNAPHDELARQLPADYLTSTTPADRLAHLELYRRFMGGRGGGGGGEVFLSITPSPDEESTHLTLHAVFTDCIGSLAAITQTLTERGINLLRVAAFCTEGGYASLQAVARPSPSPTHLRLPLTSHSPPPFARALDT